MDAVDELIARFKSEDTNRLENIDHSDKRDIVVALEDHASEQRVINFFLSVASDRSEYDLGRIGIFKVLKLIKLADPEIRNRVGRVIQDVLLHDKDDDVRDYAAMAAARYMDVEGVDQVIERVLEDPQSRSTLRWNAFAAIESNGRSPKSLESLRRLLTDEAFKQSAARVLSEWNAI